MHAVQQERMVSEMDIVMQHKKQLLCLHTCVAQWMRSTKSNLLSTILALHAM
jgi:hypothetical protein